VLDANLKIDRYNGIFENCQHPHASDEKTKFTNLPARPIYSGVNVQAGYGSPDFFLVCLDPNKTEHWGNDARGVAPNGDGLATAGPNEFKMLMRSCLRAPAEYSCPECCRPTR
jgi:hypothetical protein